MSHTATGRPRHHHPAVLPIVHPTSGVMALAWLSSCRASANPAIEPEQDKNTVSRSLMEPDPTCSPVLYAKPDLSSLNGRCLRAVEWCVLPSHPLPQPPSINYLALSLTDDLRMLKVFYDSSLRYEDPHSGLLRYTLSPGCVRSYIPLSSTSTAASRSLPAEHRWVFPSPSRSSH
ncbi:hypothetical protein EDB86DRAFT_3169246 [Lactarius hatsudake]|nr:hypothetical protein EDB86DRAFT_3169246 [Lactarius hatsudake]